MTGGHDDVGAPGKNFTVGGARKVNEKRKRKIQRPKPSSIATQIRIRLYNWCRHDA